MAVVLVVCRGRVEHRTGAGHGRGQAGEVEEDEEVEEDQEE
jgi:hypothetical protein